MKFASRGAKFGAALFRALDAISENAELIDAFFDALPQDVRRRWSKGRESRGLLDQAGQYGIDGADWKIQALWHNWYKVDANQAFRNIFKNQIEDKVVGLYARSLPKGASRTFQRDLGAGQKWTPEGAIAQQVDAQLEQLFEWLDT